MRRGQSTAPPAKGAVRKILIVEDNDLNRDVLSRRLKRRGYEISAAIDGAEALVQVENYGPDIVLMDMSLPGIDGWEATARLRARGSTVPIIAVTAHATLEDRERCIRAGCDDFATKPIELPALLLKIERLLGGGRV